MVREIISFIAVAVFLAVLIFLPHKDWRSYEREYRRTADKIGSGKARREVKAVNGNIEPEKLEQLFKLIADEELADRVDRLSDSLQALTLELNEYRDLLLSARETVRYGVGSESKKLRGGYFSAVRDLSRLGQETGQLSAEADSLRESLRAAERLASNADRAAAAVPEIHQIRPSRVPVREACTSCHLLSEDSRRAMLYPGGEEKNYPPEMLQHPPLEFGCTICHRGSPDALEFGPAHDSDSFGQSFRPGRMALRSCGVCHADRSPLRFSSVPFDWPPGCIGCHEQDKLSLLADSSTTAALRYPLDSREFRFWLLRHWGEKLGKVPDREEFEQAAAMLISGRMKTAPVETDSGSARAARDSSRVDGERSFRCPACGRTFNFSASGEPACPLDGTPLEPVRN